MITRLSKYRNIDKFIGYMPNKPHFVHDDYYVSRFSDNIHISSGYKHTEKNPRGFKFGVAKKMHKASGQGINTDSYSNGKGENS